MSNWTCVITCSTFLACVACGAESERIIFASLKIPIEYVIQTTDDVPKGIYDDQDVSILLGVSDKEVKESIPAFKIENRGKQERSFILHKSPMDLLATSQSFFSDFGDPPPKAVADSYLKNSRRLDLTYNRWLLVSEEGNQDQFQALCSKEVGIEGQYDICHFKANIGGFGVGYSLQDGNISLAEEFEKFIFKKISEWKTVD